MRPFQSFRVRANQGTQFIADLRGALPKGFRGRPVIGTQPCAEGCTACRDVCPTNAVALAPVAIDLARCVFCDECTQVCPAEKIEFTSDPRMAATDAQGLVVAEGATAASRTKVAERFAKHFGRSLRMRQVSAGGCNACELELGALSNVNFDLQRYGIEWVASPRHADALVVSGTLTAGMRTAIRMAWDAMPEPRFLVAFGACALSAGLYEGALGVERSFLTEVGPALWVPGCPPHPLTFAHAILDFLGIGEPRA